MRAVDEDKLEAFVGQVITELGAIAAAPLVVLGDRLGLYRAMADGEPVTAAELARRTGTTERYVREWLSSQAAGGYVAYDGPGGSGAEGSGAEGSGAGGSGDGADRFHLEPEQAVALTDESSPACVLGGFEIASALSVDLPKLLDAFRSGGGIGWHEHDPALFSGTARFFRPGYEANLVPSWLPALDDVVGRLTSGGTVMDVGCGFGHSTLVMAQAFPASRFVGSDYHEPSIESARKLAASAGMGERVTFEVAGAQDFSGRDFDLLTYFDCLHDMGDPVGALRHARQAVSDDGTVMLVEPLAGDGVADNLNPVGRLYYAASTSICTPSSLAQDVGAALGAQAGEARLRAAAEEAGFTRFRRATETPVNMVLELRP
ncbi:MAG: class I SAM-dependent methyltransferase [Pseudonocardia sp.]|nr:class I SAM-dependent methyltransferase [Pseudonocardia sp.]